MLLVLFLLLLSSLIFFFILNNIFIAAFFFSLFVLLTLILTPFIELSQKYERKQVSLISFLTITFAAVFFYLFSTQLK